MNIVKPQEIASMHYFFCNRTQRWFHAALALGGLLAVAGSVTFAANTSWAPPSGSVGNLSWFTPVNWNTVVPTSADVATFANASVAFVEGTTAANAANLSVLVGGVTIGDFNAGTLNVGGQLAITGGRVNLNFGTISVNTLAVGTAGTFADTRSGTLNLTGSNPTITMALVNVVVNSQVTGTSGLIVNGPGNLVLGNLNTYSGGTTINSGTTLQVGNGGTSGTLGAGNVGNAGTLVFGRTDTVLVPNLISGAGTVRQAGQGTTTLTADNTFSGGTTISAGTLQVGNGGTTGALGTGSVSNGGTLAFNRSDDLVFGNVINGAGIVAQTGTGKLTLLSNNTYAGGTAIVSGSLQIGNGGTEGSLGTGNILNNGALAFSRSDAVVISSQIAGTGGLTQAGTGTLTLAGNNTYTGGTIINTGILQVGSGGTSGSLGTGNVTNLGSLLFVRSDSILVPNVIVGTGSVQQTGAGTTVLTGSNTYTGTTTITSGTLQVGNAGATGSLGAGNVSNAGTLVFGRTDTVVVPNLISGAGTVRQAGQGTTTLTADNTFSGGTTISAGTLQVGNGGTTGALGTGSVSNGGTLAFNRSDDLVFGNVISGVGIVAQTGTGKLTLLSNNTYAGGTAIVSGSLQIGNGGTAGSLGTGNILNNGALAFNRSDAVVISSQIAGTGGLTQAGNGTLTLAGNNTYTGGTIINTGTLQVGSGGTSGSLGTGNVTNLGSLVFARSDSILVPNVIVGTGSVQQTGAGTIVLTGSNTYTGTTTITSGTLQVGNAGTTGSLGAGNVIVGGSLVFNRTDTALVANAISGTGTLQQSGSGTLTLTGANTHTGGTQINSGTLQVGNGGTVGSLGTGITTNNSRLSFNRSDSLIVDSVISGTGNVNQIGTGTLILTADNTYAGTTTITAGTLQIGNGGTTGSLSAGNVINNSALAFNRSDKVTPGNAIGGTGSLQQVGSGTLVLSSNNTYTGGTVVKSGVLQVGDGGTTGSLGQGTVTNAGRLVFNRSDSLSIDTVIDGTGSVRHAGPATLTLSGNNSYSGGTLVDGGGTLRVINSTSLGAGDLNLANGTVKADAGSLTARTTITVRGNYAQSTGTVLELGVSGTSANASDQVKVSGKAALNGTLRLTALGSFRPMHNTKVLVLSADGGVSGRFTTFENNLSHSPLLEPQLKFNANDVTLLWGHLSFQPYAGSGNQKMVASALDSLVTSTAADDIQLIDHLDYDFVANLKSGLRGALEKITPEGLTATFGSAFAVMDIQGNQFLKRADELLADYPAIYSAAWRDRAASTTAFDDYVKNPWSVYVEFPISSFTVTGDSEARGYDVSTRGVTFGFDRRIRDNVFVGLAANYSASKGDISDGGNVDTKSTGVNAYAVWSKKGLHLVGMVGGASNTFDTKRQSFGGLASGSSTGTAWTGLVGGGYDFQKGSLRIGTQLTGQYMSAGIDKFTERGSFSPFRIEAQNPSALHSQLGLNLRYRYLVQQWTVLTPFCYFGWRHDFMVDRLSLDAQSASGAGNVFRVYGPKLGAESLIGNVGLSVQWRPVLNTSLSYTKQVGRSGYESNSAQLAARLSF